MTKFFLLISSLVLPFLTLGQSILNPQFGIGWGYPYHNSNDSEKLKLIHKIQKQNKLNSSFFPTVQNASSLQYFHVTNIDNDELLDVIYAGPYGEGNASIIYKNNGNSFTASGLIPGKIVGARKSELSGILEIKTHEYPCCASNEHYLRTIIPFAIGDSTRIMQIEEYVYLEDTKEPVNKMKKVSFATVNEEYKLRLSPYIDSDHRFHPETIDGNTISIYPKGSRGIAIAKESDETGRIWWFVIMENNLEPIKTIMHNGENSKSMGWMSSRYVETF